MNIEVSDEKYWKKMTYYDGLLYISLLDIDGKNDWRMLTEDDVKYIPSHDYDRYNTWVAEDLNRYSQPFRESEIFWILPVRDI